MSCLTSGYPMYLKIKNKKCAQDIAFVHKTRTRATRTPIDRCRAGSKPDCIRANFLEEAPR